MLSELLQQAIEGDPNPDPIGRFYGEPASNFTISAKKAAQTAHIIIDIQRNFCEERYGLGGGQQTIQAAQDISRTVPALRDANIPHYWVYMYDEKNIQHKYNPEKCCGGFYQNTPQNGDFLIPKSKESAFEQTDLTEQLTQNNIKYLLISGVYANACVYQTVLDALALQQFEVAVFNDLTANMYWLENQKSNSLASMQKLGAHQFDSHQYIQSLPNAAPIVHHHKKPALAY